MIGSLEKMLVLNRAKPALAPSLVRTWSLDAVHSEKRGKKSREREAWKITEKRDQKLFSFEGDLGRHPKHTKLLFPPVF